MQTYIYKSHSKPDTYVYLRQRDDFSCLPDALRSQLGTLTFVFELLLEPTRKLALADPVVVIKNLNEQGFYVQFKPTVFPATVINHTPHG